MKQVLCLLTLMLYLTSCVEAKNSRKLNSDGTGEEVKFTSQDATKAIDAFNNAFYDKSFGVYYATTKHEKRAAIWTQAIYWDMVMNAWKRTKDAKYRTLMESIFEGAARQYDNYNWANTTEWFIYDDIMWWVISLARAYQLTNDDKYLILSKSGFDRVWNGLPGVDKGSYDPESGGMYWGWKSDQRGKTACINYPTVIAAITLYDITKEKHYFDKAIEIYGWSRNVLFDKEEGKIADHQVPGNPTNWKTQLYNQATAIGSAVMLYKETKDEIYLQDAILIADYTKDTMSDDDGMLFYKTGIEQGIYNAIFAQYIAMLVYDLKQEQYLPWLRYNINTAWKNRDKTRNLTYKDIKIPCPTGLLEVYDTSGCPALMQVIRPE